MESGKVLKDMDVTVNRPRLVTKLDMIPVESHLRDTTQRMEQLRADVAQELKRVDAVLDDQQRAITKAERLWQLVIALTVLCLASIPVAIVLALLK
jgi:hypothetical protein